MWPATSWLSHHDWLYIHTVSQRKHSSLSVRRLRYQQRRQLTQSWKTSYRFSRMEGREVFWATVTLAELATNFPRWVLWCGQHVYKWSHSAYKSAWINLNGIKMSGWSNPQRLYTVLLFTWHPWGNNHSTNGREIGGWLVLRTEGGRRLLWTTNWESF